MKPAEVRAGIEVYVSLKIRELEYNFEATILGITKTDICLIRPHPWEDWMDNWRMPGEPEGCLKLHCKYLRLEKLPIPIKSPALRGA
jgi:hypothetical protein